MTDVRPVPVAALRQIVTDASELQKGTEIADRGGLAHLSRHENKLFADAAGSGSSPYKVQIVFGEEKLTGRCSCMAARSRPYCKHAAALLVSWARSPDAFAIAEAPPSPPPGASGAKKATVKKGTVDTTALRTRGVEQAHTLLSELFRTGTGTLAADRADQVGELASSLRELGLRRLASRTVELAASLRLAARRDASFDAEDYATLVSDMWLTVRKLEKHLAGEALADEHVEELIGKTWTKKDRKPIAGLDLVEYAFLQRTTADGFLLRESRFLDLASGEHFAEKQILPAQLAKRIPPKPSYTGERLVGASGSLFPSFAPRRLDLEESGAARPVDQATLRAFAERALPSVSAALALLADRRRDPFAPPVVPVFVRVDWITPTAGPIRFLDEAGGSLFHAGGRGAEATLIGALARTRVLGILGDVMLEGSLPSLLPLAVLGETDGTLRLLPLGGEDGQAFAEARQGAAATLGGADLARLVGVSKPATLLGEVRDDLARGFTDGAQVSTSTRFLEPLAARLDELSLGKQAVALRQVATAPDAIEALDGLVKIHQVLGIALSRLASAAPFDVGALLRVPSLPSVGIVAPRELLPPSVAVAKEARGEISRFERAYHVALHYEAADPDTLLREVHSTWGDGLAAPYVIAAARKNESLAIASARTALGETRHRWRPPTSRLSKLTAIDVLAAIGSPAAKHVLEAIPATNLDTSLHQQVRRRLRGPLIETAQLDALIARVGGGSSMDDRADAIHGLAEAACLEAIPAIRAALDDRTSRVRRAAAHALASLGDTESLDVFVAWLGSADHERAKTGASAIGTLGDVRGGGALLGALASGFSPQIVTEALTLLGPWVLSPLLDLLDANPELAKRASVASLVQSFPMEGTASTIAAWIAAAGSDAGAVARRAKLGLEASSRRPDVTATLIEFLREETPGALEGTSAESKALKRKIDGIEKPKPKKATV